MLFALTLTLSHRREREQRIKPLSYVGEGLTKKLPLPFKEQLPITPFQGAATDYSLSLSRERAGVRVF
jgi:hypothetical protein